ncbi:hypothetical protein SteCoe_24832 [Stentor coeruleus]|uniref:Uncharacterized protein n=1 Tax=Stentor coeruleus TaxID=5963 RepID=A0A1R2BGM9_9CILI|nr:hypothetical protein SteCoe_24832 [Stentor coeruleus]
MDFSGNTDFDMTFEEHVIIPRAFRPLAKTPKFKNTMNMYSTSPTNESNDVYAKIHEESFGPYTYYIKSEARKIKKNNPVYVKKTSEHGLKDDSIPDIRNKNNSFQESKNGHFKMILDFEDLYKVRNCDIRRLKIGKYHNRCQTVLTGDNGENESSQIKRIHNNIKFMKKELIPQTKANNNLKSQSPSTGLKIKGIIKNFTIRR